MSSPNFQNPFTSLYKLFKEYKDDATKEENIRNSLYEWSGKHCTFRYENTEEIPRIDGLKVIPIDTFLPFLTKINSPIIWITRQTYLFDTMIYIELVKVFNTDTQEIFGDAYCIVEGDEFFEIWDFSDETIEESMLMVLKEVVTNIELENLFANQPKGGIWVGMPTEIAQDCPSVGFGFPQKKESYQKISPSYDLFGTMKNIDPVNSAFKIDVLFRGMIPKFGERATVYVPAWGGDVFLLALDKTEEIEEMFERIDAIGILVDKTTPHIIDSDAVQMGTDSSEIKIRDETTLHFVDMEFDERQVGRLGVVMDAGENPSIYGYHLEADREALNTFLNRMGEAKQAESHPMYGFLESKIQFVLDTLLGEKAPPTKPALPPRDVHQPREEALPEALKEEPTLEPSAWLREQYRKGGAVDWEHFRKMTSGDRDLKSEWVQNLHLPSESERKAMEEIVLYQPSPFTQQERLKVTMKDANGWVVYSIDVHKFRPTALADPAAKWGILEYKITNKQSGGVPKGAIVVAEKGVAGWTTCLGSISVHLGKERKIGSYDVQQNKDSSVTLWMGDLKPKGFTAIVVIEKNLDLSPALCRLDTLSVFRVLLLEEEVEETEEEVEF